MDENNKTQDTKDVITKEVITKDVTAQKIRIKYTGIEHILYLEDECLECLS